MSTDFGVDEGYTALAGAGEVFLGGDLKNHVADDVDLSCWT